ncbi:hypothetical protein [Bradyrhizobium sp. Ai1a-2]|uniref:hypothetical protein n=1 Tax=Bradyrhizobium sp. Ai1a-2 TaxID=196490 RepID=UPI0004848106|nr:hypothetical protein [Bradyrhizobium sp. Ai1a-2]
MPATVRGHAYWQAPLVVQTVVARSVMFFTLSAKLMPVVIADTTAEAAAVERAVLDSAIHIDGRELPCNQNRRLVPRIAQQLLR